MSKGLRDVLLGYNLGFKSQIRPCKNYQREGNFFEKILPWMKGSLKLLTKCQNRKKLISFDNLRKDTLHTRKKVLLHHLSSKVDLCTVIHIHMCSEIYNFRMGRLSGMEISSTRGMKKFIVFL